MSSPEEQFLEDTKEALSSLEDSLLNVEGSFDQDLYNAIFRDLHTIKGSLHMFDRKELGDFAHEIESVFEDFNETGHPFSIEVVQLCLQAIDFIRDNYHLTELEPGVHVATLNEMLDALKQAANTALEPVLHKKKKSEKATTIFFLEIELLIEIKEDTDHPILFIIRDLLEDTEAISHAIKDKEGFLKEWRVVFASDKTAEEIESLFLFVDDDLKYQLEQHPLDFLADFSLGLASFESQMKEKKPLSAQRESPRHHPGEAFQNLGERCGHK